MTLTQAGTRLNVARNAMVLLSSSFCARFMVLGFNILIARYLGVEQFGIYAFAISFVTLLSVLVEFSLQQLIIRDVARNPDLAGSYFSNALALKCIFFLLVFALLPITTKMLGYSQQIQTVLYILSVGLVFDAVTNCCVAIFNATQQMSFSGALGVIEEICFTALGVVILVLGGGLTAIVACRVIAQAVTQLTGLFFLTKKLHVRPGPVRYSVCRNLAEHGLTFFGVSVFTATARNLDTVLLLSMQSATAAGIYAAAAKLVKVASYFSKAFSDALYPVLSRQAASQDSKSLGETYGQSMKWLMVAVVPFVAFATVQSADIMRFLYGLDFVEASVVFQIFAWRAALGFFTQFCGTTLYALGRQRVVFRATGAGVTVSLILYVILIPRYSYTGAAVASLAALVTEFFLQFPSILQRSEPGYIKAVVLKSLGAGIVMAGFCALFNFIPLIPLAFVALLVYGGCLIASSAISRTELQTVLRSSMSVVQRKTVREVYK